MHGSAVQGSIFVIPTISVWLRSFFEGEPHISVFGDVVLLSLVVFFCRAGWWTEGGLRAGWGVGRRRADSFVRGKG